MIPSILEQTIIFLPLAIGAYLTLSLLKLPDFALESAYLFGAVSACLSQDLSLPFIGLSAVGGGILVGLVVSFLNQILGLPYLLAAIATNGLFHGATQYFLGTSVKSYTVALSTELSAGISILMLIIVSLSIRSQLGYSLAIYGNNSLFFANHRMAGKAIVIVGVIIGHGLAGLSGFLFAQSTGFVDLTMNVGIILLCLTTLMIGKLCFRSSRPNILVPLLGICFYFLMQQTLLRMGLNLKYFNAFQALFILAVLWIGHKKQTLSLDHLGV